MTQVTLTVAQKLDAIAALEGARVAFDGCHKMYLIFTEGDAMTAHECGYTGGDIHPVSVIHDLWDSSCGLRFVSLISLAGHPLTISQFEGEE